ncbi:surface antigen variable number [Microseira wollei NIES-4236]|uniref:Surface antigen variable number n=2 Tax=Microseira wollei TaxID=467598 RepID=A0AAV3X8T3_9CYAN|nr:surface antigen variable number [Microseira wollei NIES-4236]
MYAFELALVRKSQKLTGNCLLAFLWCVEVFDKVNKMRLSPVLLAAVAASTAFSNLLPAKAQTADASSPDIAADVKSRGRTRDEKKGNNSKEDDSNASASLLKPVAKNEINKGTATAATSVETPMRDSLALLADLQPKAAAEVFPSLASLPHTAEDLLSRGAGELLPIRTPELLAQAPATPSPTDAPTDTFAPESAPTPPPTPQVEPETPGTPGTPPQGTPTPTQETPNQIQLELNPPPSSPNIELNIPQRTPGTPEAPSNAQPSPAPDEPRVLVAEVVVSGAEGDLQNVVYDAIRTQPGRTTTRSQLQQDINAIFATGFFTNVRVVPEDTPLGVRITFIVEQNPVLKGVKTEGTQAVTQSVINEIFSPQYGRILNFRDLQAAIKRLNQWYQERGFVLAQVVDSRVSPDGTVTLVVAEGVVEDIQVRFLNKEGDAQDAQGRPIRGRTRQYIILREMELKPGQVFNRDRIQSDLRRVFGLGLFEDVQVSLSPGQDPRRAVVTINVKERSSGSIAAGAGFSSASGLFGSVSYQQQNVGGNNQKLGAEVQLGQRELLFDLRFTDPWIGGDPYRTSYTVNFFRRRSISLIFDGGEREVELENGDRPRIVRLGGGVTFNRPLARNPFIVPDWQASLGLQYQRVSIRDRDGDISPEDELGNDLSFSGEGSDDLVTVQFGLVRDVRNDRQRPTSGSLFRVGVDQSIPIGLGSIFLTRLRGSYSYYVPVRFTGFARGPQALAFNLQAGTVLFDLPPYEAFSLGGANSVRGYDEGDLGSGRSYVQATAEYRFPIFNFLGGALFVDFGSDLGTDSAVPGNPAGIRRKPGTGFGYGLGVRIQSPLGPIRLDYGINDDGDGRFHFGIGERF